MVIYTCTKMHLTQLLYANSRDECRQLATVRGGTLFTTPDGRTVDNTQRREILVENSDFFHTPPAFDAPVRGKYLKICLFVSTQYANVTDRQTDRYRTTAQAATKRNLSRSVAHIVPKTMYSAC